MTNPLDVKLRLRPDLDIRREHDGGEVCWIVEDRLNSSFYRIGEDEYAFISYLDGSRTAADAFEQAQQARPECQLTDATVQALCQWLSSVDLLQRNVKGPEQATWLQLQTLLTKLNPFFIRVPLLRPNKLLERIEPLTRWLFSPLLVTLSVGLLIAAIARIAIHWSEFSKSTEGIFSPGGSFGLLVCWVVLKIIHETGHGLVCKRYGGYVRDAGIMLILFVPVAFIDVTSSWRFRSKWQRILTSSAGMYVELIAASIAALCWNATSDSPANQWLANCVIMASVSTILFNANPLMRFDGYYILSDWCGIPNLYTRAAQYLRNTYRRAFFGLLPSTFDNSHTVGPLIKLYGVASWMWRVTIVFGLVIAAATMFEGAGIVLAGFGVLLWCAIPLVRTAVFLIRGNAKEQPSRWRFAIVTAATATACVTLGNITPWPFASAAPAVVEYAPLTVVRAASDGFVRAIAVTNGELVNEGDVLLVLENETLDLEITRLKLDLAQSQLRMRRFRNEQEMADFKSESSYAHSIEKQLAEKQHQRHQLTVIAPQPGRVLHRYLDTAIGTYLEEGDEICTIGDESSKELLISLAQSDVEDRDATLAVPVEARIEGGESLICPITKVSPRASTHPIHESLCATNGGPLPVQHSANGEQLEFLTPRFKATAKLTPAQSLQLKSGQQFPVNLDGIRPTVAGYLWRWTVLTWNRTFDPQT